MLLRIACFLLMAGLLVAGCSNNHPTAPSAPTQTPAPPSPTPTLTKSPTPPGTATATASPTNSATNSPTQTPTPTPSLSPTFSRTFTLTPSSCPTSTTTNTPTNTATNTLAPGTWTPTDTATNTATFTPTSTNTPLDTPTLIPCSASTTFGSLYATNGGWMPSDDLLLNQFSLYWQSNLTGVTGVLEPSGYTSVVVMAVYDEQGGYPNNLVWVSAPITILPGATGPITLTASPNLSVPAGNYWVGYWGGGNASGYTVYDMNQALGSGNMAVYSSVSSFPSTLPAFTKPKDNLYNYTLSIMWTACHQPIVTPTPTESFTPTLTPTSTITPTGTIPTNTPTVTATPT